MKELLLFRLHRLGATAAQPLLRLCEGRYAITRREWRLIAGSPRRDLCCHPISHVLRAWNRPAPRAPSQAWSSEAWRSGVPLAHDRRYVEIHLTESARDIYRSLAPVVQQLNERLLSILSEADRVQLERLVTLLEGAASLLASQPDLPKANRRRRR